jgi:hypothetical protein
VKQSIPFSYLTVQAISTDGTAHTVSVYTDISAEWTSASDDTQTVVWQSNATGPVFTHQVMLETQQDYTEYNDFIMRKFVMLAFHAVRAEFTSILHRGSCLLFHNERTRAGFSRSRKSEHSHQNGTSTTYQTGQDIIVRAQFINSGVLANTFDTDFRAISDDWPVFAFAQDLGTVSGTSGTAVFVIGHVRDPAVEYIIAGGEYQARSLYSWSAYPSGVEDMVSTALTHYMILVN